MELDWRGVPVLMNMKVRALLEATAVLLRSRPSAELWLLIVIKVIQIDNGIDWKPLINTGRFGRCG
jgi:hypothetical protein